ncbi:MAG: CDP-alcohol phosphatidyltransferase family protein [Bacillota bacterium]|nr:CDP-alcohol phosphatidyltransferase family protein [Bacillota bacterium]
MIDSKLRDSVQPIFDQTGSVFVKLKIQPDQITIAAFIGGLFAGGLVAYGQLIAALILLWISGLLDVLDGTVARLTGKSSSRGAYMDLVFDRMVEAAIVLGFYLLAPEYALAYILFFIGAMFNFTTFMVAGALFDNDGVKSMHYDIGIAERTETFIVFSLMMLFPGYIFGLLIAFDLLMFVTGLIRFVKILRVSKSQ